MCVCVCVFVCLFTCVACLCMYICACVCVCVCCGWPSLVTNTIAVKDSIVAGSVEYLLRRTLLNVFTRQEIFNLSKNPATTKQSIGVKTNASIFLEGLRDTVTWFSSSRTPFGGSHTHTHTHTHIHTDTDTHTHTHTRTDTHTHTHKHEIKITNHTKTTPSSRHVKKIKT